MAGSSGYGRSPRSVVGLSGLVQVLTIAGLLALPVQAQGQAQGQAQSPTTRPAAKVSPRPSAAKSFVREDLASDGVRLEATLKAEVGNPRPDTRSAAKARAEGEALVARMEAQIAEAVAPLHNRTVAGTWERLRARLSNLDIEINAGLVKVGAKGRSDDASNNLVNQRAQLTDVITDAAAIARDAGWAERCASAFTATTASSGKGPVVRRSRAPSSWSRSNIRSSDSREASASAVQVRPEATGLSTRGSPPAARTRSSSPRETMSKPAPRRRWTASPWSLRRPRCSGRGSCPAPA